MTTDPLDEPVGIPAHRSQKMPRKIQRSVWAAMTKEQREGYLRWVREYHDALEQERRDARKGRYGY